MKAIKKLTLEIEGKDINDLSDALRVINDELKKPGFIQVLTQDQKDILKKLHDNVNPE